MVKLTFSSQLLPQSADHLQYPDARDALSMLAGLAQQQG